MSLLPSYFLWSIIFSLQIKNNNDNNKNNIQTHQGSKIISLICVVTIVLLIPLRWTIMSFNDLKTSLWLEKLNVFIYSRAGFI